MNILYIGDIVGRPGRNAVKQLLPQLKEQYQIDLVLANGENLAGGLGLTLDKYQEMRDAGVDYFTTGNHVYRKEEFTPYLDDSTVNVIRPANFTENNPGRGEAIINLNGKRIQLINLIGHAFIPGWTRDYFEVAEELLKHPADIRIVDFHAEATSEKAIFGYSLDGVVTVFVGTHTHVPTADERILPKGTAFQSDLGMTGPLNSSLGADLTSYITAAKMHQKAKYVVGDGPVVFNSTLIKIDDETNKATAIERIQRVIGD